MSAYKFQARLKGLYLQRTRLFALVFALLGLNFIQACGLFFKHERVIIHPPELTQSYWVEGNRFSPSYLEEMALYFCHLLLDITPGNLAHNYHVLLRYTLPESFGAMKAQFTQDEAHLTKQQVSLHFYPDQVALNPKTLTARITGQLQRYVGLHHVGTESMTYEVSLAQNKGRLFLKSFQAVPTT